MSKRTIKTIVISKHIHCGFASWQSGDEYAIFKTNSKELDFVPVVGQEIQSKKFPALNGEVIEEVCGDKLYTGIYLKPDETFYQKARFSGSFTTSYEKTPEFQTLVQSYLDKGFIKDRHIPEQIEFWDRQKLIKQQSLKKQGVVLWMGYDECTNNPDLYQGGFSDEVFRSKELYAYVKRGAFGWIGNSDVRTAAHDKQIEQGLRKRGISPSKMYSWISSSDGRHFGDSLEGYTKKEQKIKIDEALNGMYNNCLIFSLPSHGGMYTDSKRIKEVLEKLGLLLPYNQKYNKKTHINNLLCAKEKLSSQTELNNDEQHIVDMINDIFANQI